MKKNIVFLILSAILVCGGIAGIIIAECCELRWLSPVSALCFTEGANLVINFSISLADRQNWQKTLRRLRRNKTIKSNDYIRISFAYLFRIQVNGKYLLVPSGRIVDRFQPVGGVYKCYQSEYEYLKRELKIAEDTRIPIDADSENDYRMQVPAKNLCKFVTRFNKTAQREGFSNLSRELVEELVLTNIVELNTFKDISYTLCGRHFSDITYSRLYKCYELLMADIVELDLTTDQRSELISLQSKTTQDYFWATEDEIITCGVKAGSDKQKQIIAEHTYKILTITSQELINVKSECEKYDIKGINATV